MLDGLHCDLNRANPNTPLPNISDNIIDDQLSDEEKAQYAWNRYHLRNDSFIFDLFGGQLQSSVTCQGCGYVSLTFDSFWDLSLPIPSSGSKKASVSLYDCLEQFAEEEVLTGSSQYQCPKCKSPQDAIKQLKVHRTPEILVLRE